MHILERASPALAYAQTKVLLIHASFGWGHRRAAEAVAEVMQARNIQTEIRDLLEFIPAALAFTYSRSYAAMMTHARWLWKALYHYTDASQKPYQPTRSAFGRWEFGNFTRYLRKQSFTHVISTHFTPSALLAGFPANGARRFSVITDYTAHRYWKTQGLDGYFVPTNEVKCQLIRAGIDASRIEVSGIPVSPCFGLNVPRDEVRTKLQCDTTALVILVLTSGLKLAAIEELITDLKSVHADVFVGAGKHAPDAEMIQRLCRGDHRFHVFGFHPRIWELMQAADVLLSKPGGLTASEALAAGIPQLLFSPLPGQEEGNANFLISQGAALPVPSNRADFRTLLNKLAHDRTILKDISERARSIGIRDAAVKVTEAVLNDSAV